MRYMFGDAVTVHHGQSVIDDRGNETWVWTDVDVPGCAVWPRVSTEAVQAMDQVVSGLWLHAPSEAAIIATDEITVRGVRYKVDGEPGSYVNPFTGTDGGMQVALTKVTG